MNYADYHTHPVNKLIHFICIPFIVLTTINFLTLIKIKLLNLELYEVLAISLLVYYLINYGFFVFTIMMIYYFFVMLIAFNWRLRNNWIFESILIFTLSWVLQFLGHYIEGNRPALMTSLTQAITEAPLFSISYIFPFNII